MKLPEDLLKNNEARIKEAIEFRMLDYPEDLENCSLSSSGVLSWKYIDNNNTGESIGYFNKDYSDFIINRHWSDRMREISGNPIPECCGFKMSPGGVGTFQKPEVAWECSFCGKIIPADKN